ncbi:MAG: hypothetical protein SO072_02670 [Dysosmobacter sp.]|nr:hypothetical protein [Dysosmobacter sp.]
MDFEKTLEELKHMKVETGSFVCLGCGYEHNCSIHGCAILRDAVECIEELKRVLQESEAARADLGKRLAATQQELSYYKELERDGKLVVLPFPQNESLLDMSNPENPDLLVNFRIAIAYSHIGIVFYQPFNIFMENVERGYIRPVSEKAEAALSSKSTIPCKYGVSRHRNEIGEDEVYCELNARWMNVSLGDCLGNCESAVILEGGRDE